jgi:hypothetical protein
MSFLGLQSAGNAKHYKKPSATWSACGVPGNVSDAVAVVDAP